MSLFADNASAWPRIRHCFSQRSITASKAKASISKRPTLAGKQRRLGTSATASTSKVNRISGSTRRNVTLSGSKVNFGLGTGGFEGVEKAPAGTATGTKEEELWVTRKAGFAFLLKRAIGAFTHRGCADPITGLPEAPADS